MRTHGQTRRGLWDPSKRPCRVGAEADETMRVRVEMRGVRKRWTSDREVETWAVSKGGGR